MKLVVFLCAVSLAVAAELPPIAILRQTSEMNDGSYSYSFETENGIKVEERGANKQIDSKNAGMSSSGSYSYTAPDGTYIKVNWVADEYGFRLVDDNAPAVPVVSVVPEEDIDIREIPKRKP